MPTRRSRLLRSAGCALRAKFLRQLTKMGIMSFSAGPVEKTSCGEALRTDPEILEYPSSAMGARMTARQ